MITPGMKNCPYCAEEILADAVRCKHCRSWLSGNPLQNEWYRSRHGMISGVCTGLSEQFHILGDPDPAGVCAEPFPGWRRFCGLRGARVHHAQTAGEGVTGLYTAQFFSS